MEEAVRNLINEPRRQASLAKEARRWHQVCSSMDAIGDTSTGLQAYLDAPAPDDKNLLYLYAYGALQLLVVQQDAVRTLAEALQLTLADSVVLKDIREIRNNAVGHPTKRGYGTGYASNFITRISMTKSSFTLSTMHTDANQSQHGTVSIPTLIESQHAEIERQLSAIQASLEKEDADHVAAFAGITIRSALPSTLSYHASKLARFDPTDAEWLLLAANLEVVDDAMASVRRSVEERGLADAVPFLDMSLQDGEYLVECLHTYIEDPSQSRFQPRDMEMFSDHLRTLLKEIMDSIDEIDESYRNRLQAA